MHAEGLVLSVFFLCVTQIHPQIYLPKERIVSQRCRSLNLKGNKAAAPLLHRGGAAVSDRSEPACAPELQDQLIQLPCRICLFERHRSL